MQTKEMQPAYFSKLIFLVGEILKLTSWPSVERELMNTHHFFRYKFPKKTWFVVHTNNKLPSVGHRQQHQGACLSSGWWFLAFCPILSTWHIPVPWLCTFKENQSHTVPYDYREGGSKQFLENLILDLGHPYPRALFFNSVQHLLISHQCFGLFSLYKDGGRKGESSAP